MKKTLFPLLLLTGSLLPLGSAQAQQAVPNGPLETWVTRTGDAPTSWLTTDDLIQSVFSGFPTTASVAKSTDKHAGSFAAKLTTFDASLISGPGVLIIGNKAGDVLNANSLLELGGLPYTSRPATMQFYYKSSGTITSPDDRPLAGVMLTKTINGTRRVVAKGELLLTAAATYTLANVPLVYQAGFAPDSIHIAFGSGDYDNGNNYTTGNALYVDDVVLTGTVAATRDARLQAAVTVFPNPSATGLFALAAGSEPALLNGPFTVTDALGRVVAQQSAQPANASGRRVVDLGAQPAGVYSLRLDTPRGPVVHQLLIP